MMQVNVSVPQDQLQAAVRGELASIFKTFLGGNGAPAKAPAAPARKRAAASTAAPAKEQGTKAPKASGGSKAPKAAEAKAPPKGTNADAVLAAVKAGADSTEAIGTKTGLDKGQVNSALAVLKRNGQIHSPSRGSYAA